MTSLAGISALFSFSYALGSTKKRDINNNPSLQTYESGLQLALKALKYGTLYAFTGCGIICFGVWKLSGAKDVSRIPYFIFICIALFYVAI